MSTQQSVAQNGELLAASLAVSPLESRGRARQRAAVVGTRMAILLGKIGIRFGAAEPDARAAARGGCGSKGKEFCLRQNSPPVSAAQKLVGATGIEPVTPTMSR